MKLINESRPWGEFLLFAKNKKCTVKMIIVKPGNRTSRQMHKKRNEFWYFLTEAIVEYCGEQYFICPGNLIKISRRRLHRIIADEKPVKIIEISVGKFSEKDITRYEDDYDRN